MGEREALKKGGKPLHTHTAIPVPVEHRPPHARRTRYKDPEGTMLHVLICNDNEQYSVLLHIFIAVSFQSVSFFHYKVNLSRYICKVLELMVML